MADYDTDFYEWTQAQGAALRAKDFAALDLDNLAEEIESLGRSLRFALRSQISRIIQHQVKLQYSPAVNPRSGWRRTIRQARDEIRQILIDSPSLKREVGRLIGEETRSAVELAARDLEEHDELDSLQLPSLRKASFTDEEVLGDWFPEEPPR